MWNLIANYFNNFPAQERVAKLLMTHGLHVGQNGEVYCGAIKMSQSAIARAAGVDRRVVNATVETIQDVSELYEFFSKIESTCHLKNVAPVMGWGVIEIIPLDPTVPGILAGVAKILANEKISVRQAIVDDPHLTDEPRLFMITEKSVPMNVIPEIKNIEGVRSIIIH